MENALASSATAMAKPRVLRVYHYPQCSTCKKALKWLTAHEVAVELIDIVLHPPSKAELREVLEAADIPLKKMFNTSGASYREGGFGERLATMTEAEAIAALANDGKLIKRPMLLGKGIALVGFDEGAYEAKLG
jgi:arsenate reductase